MMEQKMKRKIVQIVPATGFASEKENIALFALDNYGQIWELRQSGSEKDGLWSQWMDLKMPWGQDPNDGPDFSPDGDYGDLNWLDTKITPEERA